MKYNVFYSWQSDLPVKSNRSVIQSCIKAAIKKVTIASNSVVLSYDESTREVSGSPDIAQTIIQKIDACDIFICDISIINKDFDGRKCPNPNVMYE
jgi:hypothetical protein